MKAIQAQAVEQWQAQQKAIQDQIAEQWQAQQ
jgi:hypothetical protein